MFFEITIEPPVLLAMASTIREGDTLQKKNKSPEDDTKVYSFSKVIENAGYRTIFLDAPISMKAGRSVTIVVEERNTNFHEGKTVYLASPSLCPDKKGTQPITSRVTGNRS